MVRVPGRDLIRCAPRLLRLSGLLEGQIETGPVRRQSMNLRDLTGLS
jgi:hypothetical protein